MMIRLSFNVSFLFTTSYPLLFITSVYCLSKDVISLVERKHQCCFDENDEVILITLNVKNLRLTIEPEININETL